MTSLILAMKPFCESLPNGAYILLVLLPLPVGPIFLAAPRSTYFWTLPVDVLGSSGRKTTVLGAM